MKKNTEKKSIIYTIGWMIIFTCVFATVARYLTAKTYTLTAAKARQYDQKIIRQYEAEDIVFFTKDITLVIEQSNKQIPLTKEIMDSYGSYQRFLCQALYRSATGECYGLLLIPIS